MPRTSPPGVFRVEPPYLLSAPGGEFQCALEGNAGVHRLARVNHQERQNYCFPGRPLSTLSERFEWRSALAGLADFQSQLR